MADTFTGTGEALFRNEGMLTRVDGFPTGILTVSVPFTQTASGELAIRIGGTAAGTEHDQIKFSSKVALAGALSASTIEGFEPQTSDTFRVLTFAVPPTGAITTIKGPYVATVDDKELVLSIGAAAPIVNAGLDGSAQEGSTFFRSGSFTNPGATSWSATVDYGDGTGKQDLALNANNTFQLNHVYADNGDYTITVEVTNNAGGVGSDDVVATVTNMIPQVNAGADATVAAGVEFSRTGTFVDRGADNWEATVDWGDETGEQPLALNPDKSFALAHTYAATGIYTVTVRVTETDVERGSGSDEFKVTVNNEPPMVTPPADQTGDEGVSKSFSLGSFADPVANGPWIVRVNWGDGPGDSVTSVTQVGNLPDLNHLFRDDGDYQVTVTVTDAARAVGTGTFAVKVANGLPVVNAGEDATINEADVLARDGFFTDLGTLDTWTATVDWGDGGDPEPLDLTPVTNDPTRRNFSLAHPYADNGTYTVTVAVTDDGGTKSDEVSVTVNNVAPTLTVSDPAEIAEGDSITFEPVVSDPAGAADPIVLSYDCDGAGPAAESDQPTCSFTDDGEYSVLVRANDGDQGEATASPLVVVTNVLPALTVPSESQLADEGTVKPFSLGSFTDPGLDGQWTVTVDWGDGQMSDSIAVEAPGDLADLEHTYAQDGAYVAKVTVAEVTAEGAEPLAGTAELDIAVANLAPVVNAGADATIDEGATFSGAVSFIDPGADVWSATVDYGDGSPVEELTPTERGFTLSHRYADNTADGSYTISVTVADEKGESGTGTDELLLTVENRNPTLEVPAPAPIPEGGTVSLDPQTSDPAGENDPLTLAYDCNGDGEEFEGTDPVCSFTDDGSYTVNVRATDDDGGLTTVPVAVTVTNVQPLVFAPEPQRADEGASQSFSLGSFSDPGPDGPWTVTVDWGDGETSAFDEVAAPGALGDLNHAYADNDTYTATVSVAEASPSEEGAEPPFGKVTFLVDVANLPPTATFGAPEAVDEGNTIDLTFTAATDASSADIAAGFDYAFDCGDGYGEFGATSTFSCPTSNQGERTVRGKLRDKDLGEREYPATVLVNNVLPTATFEVPETLDEASSFDLALTGGPEGSTYAFDCGNGYGDFGGAETVTCEKIDSGQRTFRGTVRDSDEDERSYEASITVANVAPTATLGNNGPVVAGQTVQITFTGQADASKADADAGFHYDFACDNKPLGDPDYQNAGTVANHDCTFNEEAGTYTVLGRIIDKDNGFNDYTTDVTVTEGGGGDTTPPTEPDLTLREAQAEPFQHVDHTTDTIFYNPGSQRTGAFTVIAATGDPESGITRVLFPVVFGRDKGADTDEPYKRQYTWNGADTASGPKTVTAVNGAGLEATAAFTVTPDREAPTVQIVAPTDDAQVSSGQVIEVEAEDTLSGIKSIRVAYCSGTDCGWGRSNQIGTADGDGPYQVTWSTLPKSGTYTLIARALDNVGNVQISAGVTVNVGEGTTAAARADLAPAQTASVTLSAPAAGETLEGQATLTAEVVADDGQDAAVTKVTFQVRPADGGRWRELGAARAKPYERQVEFRQLDPGDYHLRATATDRKGRVIASEPVQVTIVAAAPPSAGGGEESNDQDRDDEQRETESTPDLPDSDLPVAEPSDGPPRGAAEQPYRITGAGGVGKSGLARDGRPGTAWATKDAEAEANVWFDLGAKRPVVAVRWLQTRAGGVVELQTSTDRKHWKAVGRGGDVAPGTWQTLELEGTTRYVRFRYVGADGPARLGFLAEVEVYGPKTPADEPRETLTAAPVGDAVSETGQAGRADAKEANTKSAKKRAHERTAGSEPNGHRKANNRSKDDHPVRAGQDDPRGRGENRGGTDNPNGNPPPTDSEQEPLTEDPPPAEEVRPEEP